MKLKEKKKRNVRKQILSMLLTKKLFNRPEINAMLRKEQRVKVREKAETDPEAARELQEYRDYHKAAAERSRQKKLEQEKTDQEMARKLEQEAEANRRRASEYYYRKKAEREEVSA